MSIRKEKFTRQEQLYGSLLAITKEWQLDDTAEYVFSKINSRMTLQFWNL